MSWGGNQGWGGGGGMQKRIPSPRVPNEPEHELNPRYEAILKLDRNLGKNYRSLGDQPSRDTILFEGDPERLTIDVPRAAMILKQCGIPLNHTEFPLIKKFNTEFQGAGYYFVWSSPVPWEHSAEFRYIPGYTRYVIDRHGRVLNAWNGKEVAPESAYMYQLVSDGPGFANKPFWAKKDLLLMLAWSILPEGFIDYGMGTFSHTLEFDKVNGVYGWVPQAEIKVRNTELNEQKRYRCLAEFIECAIPPKEFEVAKLVRKHIRKPIVDTLNIGPFQIRPLEEVTMPDLPTIGGSTQEPASEVAGQVAETQQAETQQVQQPVPVQEPVSQPAIDNNTIDFGDAW